MNLRIKIRAAIQNAPIPTAPYIITFVASDVFGVGLLGAGVGCTGASVGVGT